MPQESMSASIETAILSTNLSQKAQVKVKTANIRGGWHISLHEGTDNLSDLQLTSLIFEAAVAIKPFTLEWIMFVCGKENHDFRYRYVRLNLTESIEHSDIKIILNVPALAKAMSDALQTVESVELMVAEDIAIFEYSFMAVKVFVSENFDLSLANLESSCYKIADIFAQERPTTRGASIFLVQSYAPNKCLHLARLRKEHIESSAARNVPLEIPSNFSFDMPVPELICCRFGADA